MKALLLAATSSLALAGFAMAQTTTTTAPADTPVENAAESAADTVGNTAAAVGDTAESVADETETAVDAAEDDMGGADPADTAETAADAAEDQADNAVTAGTTDTTATTTTTTDATTTTVPATTTVDSTTTAVTTPDAAAVTTTETVVAAPDVDAPVMSAENPGMLGSWIMNRRIWTTNQPSTTAWDDNQTLTERPADWNDIAKIDDIVVDREGNVMGYVADIGGFLGLGAKQVLLGKDALHLVQMNDDAFFVTNFTKEELEALPNFDTTTVMK